MNRPPFYRLSNGEPSDHSTAAVSAVVTPARGATGPQCGLEPVKAASHGVSSAVLTESHRGVERSAAGGPGPPLKFSLSEAAGPTDRPLDKLVVCLTVSLPEAASKVCHPKFQRSPGATPCDPYALPVW